MGCGSSAPAIAPLAPGSKKDDEYAISVTHFRQERVIGQGGFAKVNAVVKMTGHDAGAWYAMKTLKKGAILERNHVAMVMKERNLLAKLHCPQMVNMHYAFQDPRHLYIVMDVCFGGDLHYQLSRAPNRCFGEEQARFYAASTILCLQYMHEIGVLHRDIKPENLLLDSKGHLKVTDLGISMEVVDGTCTSTSGTRPYMAPEIFMSGHKHAYVADYYALGITVYQFLLGQRPYKPDTANMKAIVRMATFVPPDKYTDVRHIRRILIAAQERKAPSAEFRYGQRMARFSAEARDFVQSCLICNPKYRLGSQGVDELMTHPWFAGLDWEALRAQRVSPPFVPDVRVANCAIGEPELAAMLEEEAADTRPPVSPADQARFNGFDYRTHVKDSYSGRSERIVRTASSAGRDTSGSAMYGDRDRAPTISVTNMTDVLHSYASYHSNSIAWGPSAAAGSLDSVNSPMPHGSAAGVGGLQPHSSSNKRTSLPRTGLTLGAAGASPIPAPATPSSPFLRGAVAVASPSVGAHIRHSISGDPTPPVSPVHLPPVFFADGSTPASSNGRRASAGASLQQQMGTPLPAPGAPDVSSSMQRSPAGTPKSRRSAPAPANASLPPLHQHASDTGTPHDVSLPGAAAVASGDSGADVSFNFDVAAVSGIPPARAGDQRVAYPAFLFDAGVANGRGAVYAPAADHQAQEQSGDLTSVREHQAAVGASSASAQDPSSDSDRRVQVGDSKHHGFDGVPDLTEPAASQRL